MREILFKAKRTDNGEWAEGYYCKRKTGYYDNIGFHEEYKDCIIVLFSSGGITWVDIDPETLCQYTGLADKDGKKWQGDIFEASDGEFIQRYFIQRNEYELQWYAECITTPDYSMPLCEFKAEEIDVIGNIFDNPELLEQEE